MWVQGHAGNCCAQNTSECGLLRFKIEPWIPDCVFVRNLPHSALRWTTLLTLAMTSTMGKGYTVVSRGLHSWGDFSNQGHWSLPMYPHTERQSMSTTMTCILMTLHSRMFANLWLSNPSLAHIHRGGEQWGADRAGVQRVSTTTNVCTGRVCDFLCCLLDVSQHSWQQKTLQNPVFAYWLCYIV